MDRVCRYASYVAVHAGYAVACQRSMEFGLLSSVAMVMPMLLCPQSHDWYPLEWTKRYSLLLGSLFVYATRCLHKYAKWRCSRAVALAGTTIMALNVAEAGVGDIMSSNVYNGVLLLVTALLTPPYVVTEHGSGFTSLLWWCCYYGTLQHFVLYSYWFKDSVLETLSATTIPGLTLLFLRPTEHLPIRVSWITLGAFMDSVVDTEWGTWSREYELNRYLQNTTGLARGLKVINTFAVCALAYRQTRWVFRTRLRAFEVHKCLNNAHTHDIHRL